MLAGLLNFLNKAIVPGWVFTRRIYAKYSGIIDMNENKILTVCLKPHHHVKLDQEFSLDCSVWLNFLIRSENQELYRPFIDFNLSLQADVLEFYTDAAKGASLGMGGIFGQKCFFAQLEHNYIQEKDPSIEYLKLLALCVVVFCWCDSLKNRRIIFFCNNQSAVTMVNNTTSKCKNCMILLRMLVVRSLEFNMRIFCRWVMGSKNIRAELLSRQRINGFKNYIKKNNLKTEDQPSQLPIDLWPASKLWMV